MSNEKYEDYQEFRKAIANLFEQNKYDHAIELATLHQQKFLALTHIILANAFIKRAVYQRETPNKDDFIQSFININLAIKYSRDSVELFLHNDVKFSFEVAERFIKENVEKYTVQLSKADWEHILKAADDFYQEHPVIETQTACL